MQEELENRDILGEKEFLMVEQYKQTSASRRHYSSLRFALFPVFFAIQYGLIQLALKQLGSDQSTLIPIYFYGIAGILVTYVFWTIEERIRDYYQHLEDLAAKLERELDKELGFEMIRKWPRKTLRNNTLLSIRIVHLSFVGFWVYLVTRSFV